METGVLTKNEKRVLWTIGWVVFLIAFFFIFMFRTVGAGQVGIITRFGDVNRVATSGIAIKMPWPIEHIEKMETRVQKEEQDASAATADLQDVNGKLALNYALDNATALRVYKELGKDYKNRVITPAVQESFKASTAQFTAAELITKRGEVKAKAEEQRKKDVMKQLNADVAVAKNKVSKYANIVATRREQRDVIVEVKYDYEKGMVTKVRTDTNETIHSREMTTTERQGGLFDYEAEQDV